jgi:urease subunit beta
MHTGPYLLDDGPIEINPGRPRTALVVHNTGDRAIQVGSHFHFFEVNRALRFDRPAAFGRRLDIPSGTALRFEPGDAREVTLVPFGGTRRSVGFNSIAEGSVAGASDQALVRARARGFIAAPEGGNA